VLVLALVIAPGTGSAYAANTVFSTDIVNWEVKSVDIGTDEVRSADVRDDSLAGGGLAGRDIRDHSGVDTCPDGSERLVLFVAKDALSPKGFIGSAQPSSTSPQTVCVTTPTN
jgi:hypothetical protein